MIIYLALLGISHLVRMGQPDPRPLPASMGAVQVQAFDGQRRPQQLVRMAYRDTRPGAASDDPVVLVVHGSPAPASSVFTDFVTRLSAYGRVIVPDLPGFGYSTREIPDYGFKAHADYLLQFMDRRALSKVHLVAYSMGGGAAIRLAVEQADRIESLALVNSLGVQELELLGDYHLNHMLHGAQLMLLWSAQELTPHMGWLDRFFINRNYARNFFDADQRPLRGYLGRVQQPTLILHGRDDHFVLPGVAAEHARLIPQSELKLLDGGHLMVFRRTPATVAAVGEFLSHVFAGRGVARSQAETHRVQRAADPSAAAEMIPARGYLLLTYIVLIALATFISEDLACIGAGLLAARGVIGIGSAIFASFAGIVVGDLLLFAAGRYIGRAAVTRAPLKWFIKPEDLELAAGWFNAKGPGIIVASRFLPGSRLPTYLTAGILGARPLTFLYYFCLAAFLWTPALVGLAALLGHQMMAYYPVFSRYALWMVLGLVVLLYLVVHVVVPLFTFRGRRLLLSRFRKWRHWEFWPYYITYLPVMVYIFFLGLRRGDLTLFSATNPGMPAGGIVGESKSVILDQLRSSGAVARYQCIPGHLPVEDRLQRVRTFMATHQLTFPIVFKPDVGERGQGVEIVRHPDRMQSFLEGARCDTIVQQYIPGQEFGVFYYRYPNEPRGHILSITNKHRIFLTGDGRSTLETLILKDDRAVCLASLHFREHRQHLYEVPDKGEHIELVSVGAHAKGTVFLDANHLNTEALTSEVDRISRHYDGFYFGRYDIRVPSEEHFRQGRDLSVIELNGVTSEAGHAYDPSRRLMDGWSILMRQWKIAIKIGQLNKDKGTMTISPFEFLKMVFLRRPKPLGQGRDVKLEA